MRRAEAVRVAVATLRAAGCDEAEADARLLAAEAFGLTPAQLIGGGSDEASSEERKRLEGFTARRAAGEPTARILGRREFWGLTFQLSPETLVPRPDSETLVETALREMDPRDRRFLALDLGTGSGCLLLAILSERPYAIGLGVDLSPAAARTARDNAEALGLGSRAFFAAGSWGEAVGRRFDLVVSNPPYIPRGDIAALDREVRAHDPALALDGGLDGLRAYRTIASGLRALLKPDGVAVIELGVGQTADVSALFRAAGFVAVGATPDLAGVPRALTVRAAR
jgi:release factor glutamine methyltransferase